VIASALAILLSSNCAGAVLAHVTG